MEELLRAATLAEYAESLEELQPLGMEALLSEVKKSNAAVLDLKQQFQNMARTGDIRQ